MLVRKFKASQKVLFGSYFLRQGYLIDILLVCIIVLYYMFLKIERERIPVGKIAEKSSLQPPGLFRFFNIWRAREIRTSNNNMTAKNISNKNKHFTVKREKPWGRGCF